MTRSRYVDQLVEGTPDALIALSTRGEVLLWSWGAGLVFGHTSRQALGRRLSELLVDAGGRHALEQAIEEARVTGSAIFEGQGVGSEGAALSFEATLKRVDEGEPWITFFAKDTTERQRLLQEVFNRNWTLEGTLAEQNAQLRETVARLQKSEAVAQEESRKVAAALEKLETAQDTLLKSEKLAAIGQLAASVGHDLRNPLAAIRNGLHWIEKRSHGKDYPQDARLAHFLRVMDQELNACVKIISDLLDFARERPLDRRPCPLGPLIDESLGLVQPRERVKVEANLPNELPVLCLDKDLMRRVLVNLAQNAVDAIAEPREGLVRVTARSDATHVTLIVCDNGAGMAPEIKAHIFDPLFTTKLKGTGLGLAIVSNIVRRHGATLEVESVPDVGSTFTLRLPISLT